MLLILLGSLFTLIVGVISVVSETHREEGYQNSENKKRKLTNTGKIAVVCLFLGATVTAIAGFSQSNENKRDAEQARKTFEEARKTSEEAKKISAQNDAVFRKTQEIGIQTWRDSREIEGVSGYASLSLDLRQIEHSANLDRWLGLVTAEYRRSNDTPQKLHASDKFGNEYVEIKPDKNW